MTAPCDSELLALWEQGATRHPIDRSLLLAAWARADLAPESLPDLPLGALNAALLSLRAAWFGRRIDAYVDCETCGNRLALTLDTGELLAATPAVDDPGWTAAVGMRLRAPCSRDLAAAAAEPDAGAAALVILRRCGLGPDIPGSESMPEAEKAIEALDPGAEVTLALECDACGQRGTADLDPGTLLWEEIAAHAHTLLLAVHELARAYGWSESEILALTPRRRAAYLELVGA